MEDKITLKRVVLDTNVLMGNLEVLDEYSNVVLPIIVIEELDKLKTKPGEVGYKARKAIRKIEADESIQIMLVPNDIEYACVDKSNDNVIIAFAKHIGATLVTSDLNMVIKAKAYDLDVDKRDVCSKFEKHYMGYKELSGGTDYINKLFSNPSEYGFLENEYLILHNTDTEDSHEYKFKNGELLELRLPSSKSIKGANSHQRLALDLLNNKDIPIKIIVGCPGSGKTFLATKVAINSVLKSGTYSKILVVREVSGDGKEIGFLPGDMESKTGDFFKPIEHSLNGGEFELAQLIQRGYLEKNIPFFLKGTTYNNTYMIADEAADLSYKQIKLIGTRVGQDSCVVFVGDYKQSVYDTTLDNGLMRAVEELKGNPLVGIVALKEDVRSAASKVFADLN